MLSGAMDGQKHIFDNAVDRSPTFRNQSTFIVAGSSRSGKTAFVEKLLRNIDQVFEKGRPARIIYCYSKLQKVLLDLERDVPNLQLREGILPGDEIKSLSSPDSEILLVIDDLIFDVINSKDMADLFCTGRHLNLSIIFITQNLLEQGKYSRAINLNACYIILFRNIRDVRQVKLIASQIYPGKVKDFMEVYDDVMADPYGYLVVDLHPSSDNRFRLRTDIFPFDSAHMKIYRI